MKATVYPAALKNVIDVASTSNTDLPSTFSNYGAPPVWLAAPGEGVMTTYPFGTYAAGWGTSFSAPLVAGTTAMMISTYGAQVSTQTSTSLLGISLSLTSSTTVSSKTQAAKRVVACSVDLCSTARIRPSRHLPGGASLAQQSGATVTHMGSSMISRSEFPTDFLTGATWLRVKELEGQQESLLKSVICAFNQLLDLRDLGTGIHSTRLAEWTVRIARKMGLPETDLYQLEVAALLHDIGKIGIPDSILKKEGKLTDEEKALITSIRNTAGRFSGCLRA